MAAVVLALPQSGWLEAVWAIEQDAQVARAATKTKEA
jgi:hypothetical protein